MTTLKTAVTGDVGDYRLVTLAGVDNLDAVTAIEAHVWKSDTAPTTLAASVDDSAERRIRVELGSAGGWLATATPGSWKIEYQLTFGSTVLTWPADGPDRILVRAEGD